MIDANDITTEDYTRFFVQKPDKDFSVMKNNYVIEKTIREAEEAYKKNRQKRLEGLEERADAVSNYIHHLVNKDQHTPFDKYIGKRYLAQLRGEERIAKIKEAQALKKSFIL